MQPSAGINFKRDWLNNMYTLTGWAIIYNEGGYQNYHNHPYGFLTGTFYIQMPEEGRNPDEGAIEFSHKGSLYPQCDIPFPTKIIRPQCRDLNIFPSSLFHRTLPFKGEKQRICIAFDLTRK